MLESDTRAFGKNRKVNSDNGHKLLIIPIGIDIKGKGILFSMRFEHLLNFDEWLKNLDPLFDWNRSLIFDQIPDARPGIFIKY